MLSTLPVELWRRIFQWMSLDELLVAMRVCSLWRDVAVNSDAYVTDIGLASPASPAVQLFLHRLSQSRSRQSAVRIAIDCRWEMLSSVVMRAVEVHLAHIVELDLQFHSADFPNVVRHLRRPAPLLRVLRLDLMDEHPPSTLPTLPYDLLATQAPKLRVIALTNLELPPGPVPPALSGVIHLHIGFGCHRLALQRPHPVAIDLWRGFASLKALTLAGGIVLSAPRYHDPRTWKGIERLHLQIALTFLHNIFERMPFLENMLIIEVYRPYCMQVRSCIAHIPGPLDVVIHRQNTPTQHNEICLSDRSNGRLRIFTSPWAQGAVLPGSLSFPQEAYEVLYDVFEAGSRILSLTISNTLWTQFSLMPLQYSDLVSLRIVLEDNSRLAGPHLELGKPVQCPLLSTLILRCDFDTAWRRCEDVIAFFKAALHISDDAGRPRCSLVLENVVLEGEKDDLGKYFREVQYCDPNTWSYPSYR